jgi:sugar phosphate isomerase/epimerase
VDVVKDTIEQACKIGCRLLVVHPGRISGDHSLDEQLRELYNSGEKGSPHYEEVRLRVMADRAARAAPHLAQCMESLREIVEFTRDTGLSIALEIRFHYYELPVFDELKTMLDEFTQPWVGWQFDIGHLQVHDQLGLMNARDWLEHFSPRIVGVHLHDVIGIKDHQAPGTGEVDFRLIAQHLPLDCYRTLEVDKTLTPEAVAQAMQYLRDQGCVFDV